MKGSEATEPALAAGGYGFVPGPAESPKLEPRSNPLASCDPKIKENWGRVGCSSVMEHWPGSVSGMEHGMKALFIPQDLKASLLLKIKF